MHLLWYSHFTNQIIPDYDTDPDKIIYKNLRGYAASKGATLNAELNIGNRFKSLAGSYCSGCRKVEKDEQGKETSTTDLYLTEKWSGTWAITYIFPAIGFTIDYTGNMYGPMRLPLLSDKDPRPASSPVWSIQNIQFTKLLNRNIELFGGIKNLLNWTPAKKSPFLIARSNDPFDKHLTYNPDGSIKPVDDPSLGAAHNPYGLSFDPTYVYAPNQGIRFFAGIRFTIKK